MSEDEVRNARIVETFLGVEDHGLMIAQLEMDYGGSRQAYQRIIASRVEAESVRILWDILTAVGVSSWEELRGTYCRVRIEDGLIRQIGHVIEDRWTARPATEKGVGR